MTMMGKQNVSIYTLEREFVQATFKCIIIKQSFMPRCSNSELNEVMDNGTKKIVNYLVVGSS